MTAATHTIQLSATTYKQLIAAAQQQHLEIETLIKKFLDTLNPEPPQSEHRFAYLLEAAEDLGVADLAENHDHYLYGTKKR